MVGVEVSALYSRVTIYTETPKLQALQGTSKRRYLTHGTLWAHSNGGVVRESRSEGIINARPSPRTERSVSGHRGYYLSRVVAHNQ